MGKPRGKTYSFATRRQTLLVTATAFVYTRKPTSGFLPFLNGEPFNIGAKTQILVA